ncbi:PIG-L family deacetylase [Sphingobacterium suaedae]|uniref:PIG-L family deacetylase n=1 Tax=Sphingobacterium suaedae TaxID=1686402 RepID=A0ABW5KEH7_9SPHI
MRRHFFFFLIFLFCSRSFAQPFLQKSSAEIQLGLERLNVLGSVLYFAAHPDDENTKLIAYLASERKVRTAYLSLTRGDGGQNLIGTEQGIELGLIRTQELLQARKIDGGEQYFSSAFDFGFSKTHEETFKFWKKEEVLREAVWIIRKLQPDVIITRFPPDERGGHGHHQASAILAHEAFKAAADPTVFPEQLNIVKPWQAKRLLWNTANFMRMQGDSPNQLKIDIGQFNPLLGQSYGEISARSRSQHKSQGFGSAASNGFAIESFEYVDGDKPTTDLFDKIDLSWNRVPDSEPIQQEVSSLIETFNPLAPQQSIPGLAQLWHRLQKLQNGYWKDRKLQEVEELLLACAGVKLEGVTASSRFYKGQVIPFQIELISRNPKTMVRLVGINDKRIDKLIPYNEIQRFDESIVVETTTQPYWLTKPHSLGKFEVDSNYVGFPINPDLPMAYVSLQIADVTFQLPVPLQYRYVDPVRGEVREYIEIVPPVTLSVHNQTLLVKPGVHKTLLLTLERHDPSVKSVTIVPQTKTSGWKIVPDKLFVSFPEKQYSVVKAIDIANESPSSSADTLAFSISGESLRGIETISYEHIPTQTWFPKTTSKLVPLDLINPVKHVGYITGAGDLIPEALRNLGTAVDVLDIDKISKEVLAQYDALVLGVRILNVEQKIAQKMPVIFDYVKTGGVAVFQYNVNSRLQTTDFAPKPFQITRTRVTEEDAQVSFLNPEDPVLNYPNKITAQDFEGWVQERGLYFAEDIDPSYRTPLAMNDKNETAHTGSLLITKLGKGKFIYTSLSFFRQLPAGVPGASRLFVNLLTKEK